MLFISCVVHGAMGAAAKKSFKLVWRCHQFLSGFLAKGHLPRVPRQSHRSLIIRLIMKWSRGPYTDLPAFALKLKKTSARTDENFVPCKRYNACAKIESFSLQASDSCSFHPVTLPFKAGESRTRVNHSKEFELIHPLFFYYFTFSFYMGTLGQKKKKQK